MLTEREGVPLGVGHPPSGAVNVYVGSAIEGAGGRWIPCVSAVGASKFLPTVFEVGPGRHQVCAEIQPFECVEHALCVAVLMAETAAA